MSEPPLDEAAPTPRAARPHAWGPRLRAASRPHEDTLSATIAAVLAHQRGLAAENVGKVAYQEVKPAAIAEWMREPQNLDRLVR